MDSQADNKNRLVGFNSRHHPSSRGSSNLLMDWVLAIIILLGLVGIGWLVAEYIESIERGAKGMKDEWEEYQKTLKDKTKM